ncbi:MAG: OmpH family outer membrane protein [Flavobacteriaceae bacterium]|nr:OmpH family outer membrane protein [Flavobacteriaceae bacterium]
MKKSLLILGLALALFSCNKTEQKENFKTAYIDTSVLLEKYEKFKDEDEKFKVKSQEMGRPLQAKLQAFQSEANNFQRNAQIKGMAWAQQKGAELQQREQQLAVEQDALLRQIQVESDSIRTEIIKNLKDYIKSYGKKQGYDYIYGTGDAATVLYAKDSYDITNDVLKLLNDEFKSSTGKTEEKAETAETKEEEKK